MSTSTFIHNKPSSTDRPQQHKHVRPLNKTTSPPNSFFLSNTTLSFHSITPVMICRLVLSLRKASDPNLIRAWNVDHFTTQNGTQTLSPVLDRGGVNLTPLRFRNLATSLTTSEGDGIGSENGLMVASVGRGSVVDSESTIVLGEDENSRRERGCSIS